MTTRQTIAVGGIVLITATLASALIPKRHFGPKLEIVATLDLGELEHEATRKS